jgi:hypothetical protein
MTNPPVETRVLSREFIKGLQDYRTVISCGTKGSGKSTFLNCCLKELLRYNGFNTYHLVLPSYNFEQEGSYDWLEHAAKVASREYGTIVRVYTTFNPVLAEQIVGVQRKSNATSALLVIDDATTYAHYLFNQATDSNFISIISQGRHLQIGTWILAHNLKLVLSATIREACAWLYITDISTMKLLEDIWQQWFSITLTKNEFLALWSWHAKRPYGALLLSTGRNRAIDADPNNWEWIIKVRHELEKLKPKQTN